MFDYFEIIQNSGGRCILIKKSPTHLALQRIRLSEYMTKLYEYITILYEYVI